MEKGQYSIPVAYFSFPTAYDVKTRRHNGTRQGNILSQFLFGQYNIREKGTVIKCSLAAFHSDVVFYGADSRQIY